MQRQLTVIVGELAAQSHGLLQLGVVRLTAAAAPFLVGVLHAPEQGRDEETLRHARREPLRTHSGVLAPEAQHAEQNALRKRHLLRPKCE